MQNVTSGGHTIVAEVINVTLHLPRLVQVPLAAVLVGALVAGGVLAGRAWVLPILTPNYKTEFLIDAADTASAAGLKAIAESVKTVVQNSGDSDALAVRRFGGTCGDDGNTARLVDFGTGNRPQIVQAVDSIRPSSAATLERGIVEAVDDLSSPLSLRAKQVNRIIVITRHGTDACDSDGAFVTNEIHDRVVAAGLAIEFRLVGYQVADAERQAVADLASAARAPAPVFATSQAELSRTLDRITNVEPVIADVNEILSILNPAVAEVNASVQSIEADQFDVASQHLARAKSSLTSGDAQFQDLRQRATEPELRAIYDLAARMRGQQGQIIGSASDLLSTARAGGSWSSGLAAYNRAVATYNSQVASMNGLLSGAGG